MLKINNNKLKIILNKTQIKLNLIKHNFMN